MLGKGVKIINNHSSDNGGGLQIGGYGMSGDYTVVIIEDGVVISNNTAKKYGGGIYADTSWLTELIVGNISITNNKAGAGGGIYIEGYNPAKNIKFTNTLIKNNIADYGAGMCIFCDNPMTFNSVKLTQNIATFTGGGIQTTNRNFKCDGIKMSGNKAGDGGNDFFLFESE